MNILHVVYDFTPGHYPGGIPKIVHELASAQSNNGHNVGIFSPQLISKYKHDSSPRVINYPLTIHTPKSMGNKNVFRCISQLANDYDVIHGHNTFLSLNRYVARVSSNTGIPACFHVHGALDPVVVRKGLLKSIKKLIYIKFIESRNLNCAKFVFAVTEAEKVQVRTWGVKSNIAVIPDGIGSFIQPSQASFDMFLTQYPKLKEARIVMYLGRINPKKGIDVLIEAFGAIASLHPDTLLVLAGDRTAYPKYVQQLVTRINALKLQDRIVWTGFLEAEAKRSLFASADVFSHVSMSEGMAVSILEAMSAGLPTIVSPGCYMDKAVNDGALILADYNVNALTKVLSRLLEDDIYRKKLGNKARDYVNRHHNWVNIAREITDHYQC